MPRPIKGSEPLTDPLNTKVTATTKKRIDTLALKRSRPGAIVPASDIVREALDEGLDVLEGKPKKIKLDKK